MNSLQQPEPQAIDTLPTPYAWGKHVGILNNYRNRFEQSGKLPTQLVELAFGKMLSEWFGADIETATIYDRLRSKTEVDGFEDHASAHVFDRDQNLIAQFTIERLGFEGFLSIEIDRPTFCAYFDLVDYWATYYGTTADHLVIFLTWQPALLGHKGIDVSVTYVP